MSEEEPWIHQAPSWLQLIGVLLVSTVAITTTFYTMIYSVREQVLTNVIEVARIDERQKNVVIGQKIQDDSAILVRRDRDEQMRIIQAQLATLMADVQVIKMVISSKQGSK